MNLNIRKYKYNGRILLLIRDAVVARLNVFLQDVSRHDPMKIVWIDETWVDVNDSRNKG